MKFHSWAPKAFNLIQPQNFTKCTETHKTEAERENTQTLAAGYFVFPHALCEVRKPGLGKA